MTDTSTTAVPCRVQIINHIEDQTTVIESQRDRLLVYLDLAKMVQMVNRRRDETLKASLHLLRDQIILHWHCPHFDDLALEIVRITAPLRNVEALIQGRVPA